MVKRIAKESSTDSQQPTDNARKSKVVNSPLPVVSGLLRGRVEDTKFILDKSKKPVLNTENIYRVLSDDSFFFCRLRYDRFKNALEYSPFISHQISFKPGWRALEDSDTISLQTEISTMYEPFQRLSKNMMFDAMVKVAKDRSYDSAVDFISALKWDEQNRLSSWLSKTYGTPDDVYHQAVGSNWLKGLVKRLVEPGCKFDYVLVLEGPQGAKKSTSLFILGGDWHVETAMSTDTKDFFMQFQGKAIVEFSEGETLSRTEVKRMKAIITMQTDRYRIPFERISQDFPRRCVFAMTTNQAEYLKDETGNRRWLPVTVVFEEADIEWLKNNREQLLAEAYHRVVTLKETVYELPKEETLAQQQARRIQDPNAELIAGWYWNVLTDEQRQEGITIDQVWRDALHNGFTSKPKNKYEEMSMATVLKETLNLEKRRAMMNGVRAWRWYCDHLVMAEKIKEVAF